MGSHSLLAILLLASIAGVAYAIDAQCSACAAVADELQLRLDKEKPRNHLDLRHRLDKHGKRYGKVIAYKLSELRAVELLENLCEEMGDRFGLRRLAADTNGSSQEGEAGDETADGKKAKERRLLSWIKIKGEGNQLTALGAKRLPREHELAHRRELTTFCGALLDKHEDEIMEALKNDDFGTEEGVAPVLCERIAKRCKEDELLNIDERLEEIITQRAAASAAAAAAAKEQEAAADAAAAEAAADGESSQVEGDEGVTGEGVDESSSGGSSDSEQAAEAAGQAEAAAEPSSGKAEEARVEL